TSEAIRIARAGGIPATHNVTRYAARLSHISKAAGLGGAVVLSGASLAAGCMQIGATRNRMEKNEIFWETTVSTGVGVVLGFCLMSNPAGWGLALVLAAGSAAVSL